MKGPMFWLGYASAAIAGSTVMLLVVATLILGLDILVGKLS